MACGGSARCGARAAGRPRPSSRRSGRLLLAVALAACSPARGIPDAESWPITCSRDCRGEDLCKQECAGSQTQASRCSPLDACPAATVQCPPGAKPVPCEFSEWSEWSEPLGCSGLCIRTRNISSSNRCGGEPCKGHLEESQRCPNPCRSQLSPRDCEMTAWTAWSACGSIADNQKQRSREVRSPPRNGGHDCTGLLEETAVCGEGLQKPHNCKVSAWMEWTPCTQKCGGGERMRLRTILSKAKNGGLACMTSISQVYPCSVQPCPQPDAVDCKVGPWEGWSSCVDGQQRMRHRGILVQASGSGKACDESLTETAGCEKQMDGPPSCKFDQWSEWNFCDRTCGGGQTFRRRKIAQPAKPGGEPCQGELSQTAMCNTHPCNLVMQACRVSHWSPWSPCTTTCGAGQQLRQRKILTEAQEGGLGCFLPLTEARGCPVAGEGGGEGRPDCGKTDCEWDSWSEWTACSASCEGGERSRTKVIKQVASAGGKACDPSDSAEIEACNVEPCEAKDCVDGKWEEWGEWSACTKTCGGGYRFHHRSLAREASDCGEPALGPVSEAETCNADVVCEGDVDCELSEWSPWSDCTDKCTGTKERSREIKVHRVGGGATCGSALDGEPLEELESCRDETCEEKPKVICTLGEWEEWFTCPVSCGGGQTVRSRRVHGPTGAERRRLQEAAFDRFLGEGTEDPLAEDPVTEDVGADDIAELCTGALQMTKPCNTDRCGEKVDCEYEEWTEWGHCDKCGGLQFRTRQIKQEPENEGKECTMKDTNETRKCDHDCGKKLLYCVWAKWSPWAPCSKTCGSAMTFRRRELHKTHQKPEDDPLAVGAVEKDCKGKQIEVDECKDSPPCTECIPEDCKLSEWSEWSEPKCEGLCERSRAVVQKSNDCGKPCTGVLNQTKACEANCESKDCKLSPWSTWTQCTGELDQKFHFRTILVQPAFNGEGCIGPLNMTGSCVTGDNAPVDCQVSTWSPWGECDKTCGGGQQVRTREVTQPAKNGGAACDTSLSQLQPCATQSCLSGVGLDVMLPRDCQLSAWSLWGECEGPGKQQSYRKRILIHEAEAGGAPCEGRLYETRPCQSETSVHRNCIFSTWSMWTTCPKTCGGAQHARSRSIEAHAKGHGLQCEGPLLEDAPCGEGPCPDDEPTVCKLSEWGGWGPCSTTCGEGFKKRTRTISQPAPLGAKGCRGALEEVGTCNPEPCAAAVDCKWGEWEKWSECEVTSDMCGVGFKKRHREIETMPSGGGKLCAPLTKEEVSPVVNCKGQPECCIDGEYDEWEEWGTCSATCGKGTRARNRKLRVKETWCGKPAAGPAVEYDGCEYKDCSKDQDCVFSEWMDPSPCSANCHGNRIVKRHILVNATGRGMTCEGPVEKTERCNPAEGQPEPFSCEVHGRSGADSQDCVMTEWSEWSGCSATCERGYQTRFRSVKINPLKGGEPCPESTREIVTCHSGVSCFKDRVNCEWGEWTPWSECDQAGKKVRSRGVATPPSDFGLGCEGPVREVATCTELEDTCQASDHTCYWAKWSEWTACSATCGSGGTRQRTRQLEIRNETEAMLKFESGLPALEVQLNGVQSRRIRDLSLAFVLGSACLTVILFATWGATSGLSWLTRRWESRVLEYNAIPMNP